MQLRFPLQHRPARLDYWVSVGLLTLLGSAAAVAAPLPAKASELFAGTKVWTLHLKFSAAEWEAMEPKGGGFPGGPGGLGGPGGRGGFGGGFGGPNAAAIATPAFLAGDRDKDGKLSKDEFRTMGEEWFAAWDVSKQGKLTAEALRSGINITFPFAPGGMGRGGPGGPGGAGPGGRGFPGGPGGPGGRGMNMQGQNGRNGLSAASGVDFKYVHADLDFEGAVMKDVAVRYKGNSTFMQSRTSLKRSMKVELNKYVKGQKLAGVTKLNLHSSVTDPGWMNEVLSYRLFRDAEVPASRTAYARVFLTVSGKYDKEYVGLYSIVEDVDKAYVEERFGGRDGAIFKPVTPTLFADLGEDWSKYKQTYDPKTELTEIQQRRVMEFARFVSAKSTDEEFAAGVGKYLDLDEFARFLAVSVWLSNMDSILSMGQNYYMYLHPQTNQFLFLPWDLDLSFGHFGMGGGADLSIRKPWPGDNRFLDRVMKVEGFRKLYMAHVAEFGKTVFQPDRISRQVDETAAAIRPAVAEESAAKLSNFDKVVAGETVETGGMGPGRGGPGGGKPIKAFVGPRAQSVADQLAGKTEGVSEGGRGFGPDGGGRGGPGDFGSGAMLAPAFIKAMDADKDGTISRDEFTRGMAQWFEAWGGAKDGALTADQLRAGIERDLAVQFPMPGLVPPPPPK